MKAEMYVLGLLNFEDDRIVFSSEEIMRMNEAMRSSLQKLELSKEEPRTMGGWHVYSLDPAELCIESDNFKVNSADFGYYHHRTILHFNLDLGDFFEPKVTRKELENCVKEKIDEFDSFRQIEKEENESFCYVLREIGEELECYMKENINKLFCFAGAIKERAIKSYELREIKGKLKQLTDICIESETNNFFSSRRTIGEKKIEYEEIDKEWKQLTDFLIHKYAKIKTDEIYQSSETGSKTAVKFYGLREARSELKQLADEIINFFVKGKINQLVHMGKVREEGKIKFIYTYPLIILENSVRKIETIPFSEQTTSLCFDIVEPCWWRPFGKRHTMRISIPSTILYTQGKVGKRLRRDIINVIYQHCLYRKKAMDEKKRKFENLLDEDILVKLWTRIFHIMGGKSVDINIARISNITRFLAGFFALLVIVITIVRFILFCFEGYFQ